MTIPQTRKRTRSSGAGGLERLESGKWRARWWTRDGRHLSKTFLRKQDAEAFLRQTLVDRDRSGIDVPADDVTVADLIGPWWSSIERSLKPRTAERYLAHLRLIEDAPIARLSLRDLNYAAVQGFVDSLSPRYAPRTIRDTHGVLRLVLNDGVRRDQLHRAISKARLPRIGQPRLMIPTRLEVEALAAASDKRLYAPVLLAGYCGLREGELLALHRADVHLDEGWVFVHQARNKSSGAFESTKTDSARRVYLPGRVITALTEHLDEYPGEIVVPVSASILQKSWERARRKCGLERVRFHDLRHCAASMAIHAGWSPTQVAKQLGHADATMTLRTYSHLWPDSHEDAIRRLDAYIAHD